LCSLTEVSDQNFLDVEVGEESSRRCSKKRARSVVSPITDQVMRNSILILNLRVVGAN